MKAKQIITFLIIAAEIQFCLTQVYQDNLEITKDQIKEFKTWKEKKGRLYKDDKQEGYRSRVFIRNLRKINRMNARADKTQIQGVNAFTQLTDQQFEQRYLNRVMKEDLKLQEVVPNRLLQQKKIIYKTVDHQMKGTVSPVRDQGSCGSCWAFAAVGVLEHLSIVRDNISADLSQQQIVDCTYDGEDGCDGGWPTDALNYIKGHKAATEKEYPYVQEYQGCNIKGGSFSISSVSEVKGCQALSDAVQKSVVSVALCANGWSSYKSGIKLAKNCGTSVNHAVLLVGVKEPMPDPINSSKTIPGYWRIKNSWGTDWGENGYIRLALGNTCNMCKYEGVYAN